MHSAFIINQKPKQMSILPMRKLTACLPATCNLQRHVTGAKIQRHQRHQVAISAGLMALVPYFDTALATAIIAVLLTVVAILTVAVVTVAVAAAATAVAVVVAALIYELLMSGNFTRIVNKPSKTVDCNVMP